MFLCMYFLTLHLIVLSICDWKFKMEDSTNFMLKYSIVSTRITEDNDPVELAKKLKDGVYFDIELKPNFCYTIYIKYKSPVVINPKTELVIFENDVPNRNSFEYELVEGFVMEEKYSSYVLGYVENVYFYGKIEFNDTVHYIEELSNYPEIIAKYNSTKNGISFRRTFSTETEMYSHGINYIPDLNLNNSKLSKRMVSVRGNICTLLVLLDNSFLMRIHSGNIKAAIKQVLLSIDEANSLFRSTDFDEDGYSDNIGFIIKYFILLKSAKKSRWVPKYTNKPIDGRYYMNRFSRFYLLEDVCLGVAFTGQSFNNDIVGISYSAVPSDESFKHPFGGICDRPMLNPYGLPLNTLAVSAKGTDGRIVPEYIFELSLCHELGHSFGSNHDTGMCDGHLMTAHAPKDQQRKHFIFSKCSTSMMLETIINQGQCFENDENPYCGNGIIETNEDCDCGTIRDCLAIDKCCVPRGRQNACKVKRDFSHQCHPAQGFCCTRNCTYNNLEKFNLDCTNFTNSCPCTSSSKPCKCGVHGYCTNDICSSEECTRINAEECLCPKLSISGCVTCCRGTTHSIVTCIPANELTKRLIDINELSISTLKLIKETKKTTFATSNGHYENFCKYDECVRLYFRKVNKTDYCLSFGQVGICSKDNECLSPKPKSFKLRRSEIFESGTHNYSSKTYKTTGWLSMKLFVITYFFYK